MYTGSGLQAHVLIVDDDPGARAATVMSLRRHNKLWSISEAATLDEARHLIQSPPAEFGPIDVVLTDLVLGNNNGGVIDVLEMAKRKDPFIMVILFTAQEKNLDRFEDSGPGVPSELKERVFDLFYSTNPVGMGFGLAIVRKNVRDFGGDIVETGQAGQGARFDLFLPLARQY